MITYSQIIADIFVLKQWQVITIEIVIMFIASSIYKIISNSSERVKK